MKFRERWKLAGTISSEIRFKGYLDANPSNLARIKEEPEKIAKQIRSASRITAVFTAMIVVMLAVMTLAGALLDVSGGPIEIRVAIGFSLFLMMSFVVIFFMNMMTTTGFFSAGAMKLPATLPLTHEEVESLFLLSFARVFITPSVLVCTVFPIGILLALGPLAAAAAFLACVTTVMFSMGALLLVSRWFHRKTQEASDSKLSGVMRVLAAMGLMIGMVSVYGAGSYLPVLMDIIVQASAILGAEVLILLAAVFPFSFGFLASAFAFGTALSLPIIIVAVGASSFYSAIGYATYKKCGNILRTVILGGVSRGRTGPMREVSVDTSGPLLAVIKKDLRLASRNLGSAAIFAIPIFMVVMIYPMLSLGGGTALRSMQVLLALGYSTFFAGIVVVSLLMIDTQGESIHASLPLTSKLILDAKAGIAMIPHISTMLLLAVVFAINPLITPLLILMPLANIPLGYALGAIPATAIFRRRGGGRAVSVNIASDQSSAFIAAILGCLVGMPSLVGYGLTLLATGSHILSIIVQFSASLLMSAMAWFVMPRLLKD